MSTYGREHGLWLKQRGGALLSESDPSVDKAVCPRLPCSWKLEDLPGGPDPD